MNLTKTKANIVYCRCTPFEGNLEGAAPLIQVIKQDQDKKSELMFAEVLLNPTFERYTPWKDPEITRLYNLEDRLKKGTKALIRVLDQQFNLYIEPVNQGQKLMEEGEYFVDVNAFLCTI